MSQSEIKVAAWRYGTTLGAAGIPRAAFFDNRISLFDECNFDVTATLSTTGVTETIVTAFVTSATVVIPFSYQRSSQPVNVSAVVVISG